MPGRPNAGGGKRNKDAKSQGSARSRFSQWKPPNSGRKIRDGIEAHQRSKDGGCRKGMTIVKAAAVKKSINLPGNLNISTLETLTFNSAVASKIQELLRLPQSEPATGSRTTGEGMDKKAICESVDSVRLSNIKDCGGVGGVGVVGSGVCGDGSDGSSSSILREKIAMEGRAVRVSPAANVGQLGGGLGSISLAEKLMLETYHSLGFEKIEISNVCRHLSASRHVEPDPDDILLCLLFKVNHQELPTLAPSISEEQLEKLEMLKYNAPLNDEIQVLESIYGEQALDLERLLFFGRICVKLNIFMEADGMSCILYIVDATNYPSSPSWTLYGWLTQSSFSPSYARSISLQAMKKIAEIEEHERGDPVIFSFLQELVSSPDATALERSISCKNDTHHSHENKDSTKVASMNATKIKTAFTTGAQTEVPQTEYTESLLYRTAYSQALCEGKSGRSARDRARELLLDKLTPW